MGNLLEASQSPEHVLELRLAPPALEVPTWEAGQPGVLFAQVGTLEDRSTVRNALWDKAVAVRLASSSSAALVSIFTAGPGKLGREPARFVAEVCLPYGGPGGLAELGVRAGGAAVPLHLALVPGARASADPREQLEAFGRAREHFRKDLPHLTLSIRELELCRKDHRICLDVQAAPDPGEKPPVSRREAIALELENATLDAHRRSLQRVGLEPDAEPESQKSAAVSAAAVFRNHVKHLQAIQQENERLRSEKTQSWKRLENIQSSNGQVQMPVQQQPSHPQWGRTLHVMQTELEHCRERQRKIQRKYEEQLHSLQCQMRQTRAEANLADATSLQSLAIRPVPGHPANEVDSVQARIAEAMARRDDLWVRLQEVWVAKEALANVASPIAKAFALSGVPRTAELVQESCQMKSELQALQEELSRLHDDERGTTHQQGLRHQLQQLYDELDEQHQVREDERVRSESEARELTHERKALRDKVDTATAELNRLRAKASAVRDFGVAPIGLPSLGPLGLPRSSVDLAKLREERDLQARELERLQRCEEDRQGMIAKLEREQEALVEDIGRISSQARFVEGCNSDPDSYRRALEAQAGDLERQHASVAASCDERRAEVGRLRHAADMAQAKAAALQRSYEEVQRSCDERVLRAPATPPPTPPSTQP